MSNWRELFPIPIRDQEDAATFVDAVGFCAWGPVPGFALPNLAEAMGESAWSVLDRTWFWKDDLHLARRVYYAKIIRGQPTFITPSFLPTFIAALAGPGREVERDVVHLYLDGRLSREARGIYEYLTDNPAEPTRNVRRSWSREARALSSTIDRALAELQRRFLVCKVDLTGRTRGTYSYVWDHAERFWPDAFDEAQQIAPDDARDRIRGRLNEYGVRLDAAAEYKLFLWRQ